VARAAVARVLDLPPEPPPFAWHDRDALAGLLGAHGFGTIDVHEERLAFTAASATEFVDDGERHPLAVAGSAVLQPRGEGAAVRERMIAIYERANEDPAAFRVTSRYVVMVARRDRA